MALMNDIDPLLGRPPQLEAGGTPADHLVALENENRKLRRITKVLMDRVERSMDFQGGAFSLFQTAIVLEHKIRERTLELEGALRALEESHRDLAEAKDRADTVHRRLEEAIESVNEGFALFDADDRLVLSNRKYMLFWPDIVEQIRPGMAFREIAELVAETRQAAIPNQSPDAWLTQRLGQHAELDGPHVHRLADGRWIQINERRTSDGGVVGVYTDITDIKAVEERRRTRELAEKSALLQATLDNIVQGLAVYDARGRLAAWNDRFVGLLDLPAAATRSGASFSDLLHHAGALLTGVAGREWVVERDWHARVLEISRNPMPDGGFVLTFSDITDRKLAEQALRDSESRIRLVTDAVPAMIAYVDAEERYRFVNRAYEDWFGRPCADIVNQPMGLALIADEYDSRRPYVRRVLAGEEVRFEMEHQDHDGALRYAMATYIPHFAGAPGEGPRPVVGFFALIHDITERRLVAEALADAKESLERRVKERTAELTLLNVQLQNEIRERAAAVTTARLAKAEAEQANLSKTKFLAAASHDLLQPLNAARLFVSALSDMEQPDAAREMVENVETALTAVEDLLSALLDISKLDAGAVTPEIADFPIQSLLGALATEYAPVARERGLSLKVLPVRAVVRSDIRLLRRIVQNFLANALRYTLRGRVLVGCRRTEQGLRIEIWDTGPGIPADKLAEIFQEFRRLDAPENGGRQRGMGLGLAIVDRVADMLDHRITVRSVLGRGSCFAVTVPFGTRLRPARPASAPARRFDNQLAGATVLVLDNEPAVVAGMTALLQGWQCRVIGATNGAQAAAALQAEPLPPDLLIADYHLDDDVVGLDEVARLRGLLGQPVPAVLITANRSGDLAEQAQAAGCMLLNKPVRPAQLRALMTSLLAQ